MHLGLMILWVSLLTACAITNTSTSTPLPQNESDNREEAPSLLLPERNALFDNVADVILDWEWTRELGEKEFYDVRVWRAGEPEYGITWTKDDQFVLADWLLQQGAGEYFWSIAVIEGDDGQMIREVSNPAGSQIFTVQEAVLPPDELISLPDGFVATEYAKVTDATRGESSVTVITFHNDELYALTLDGRIFRIVDEDDDFVADNLVPIFTDPDNMVEFAVGLDFYEEVPYISYKNVIAFLTDTDEDGIYETLNPIIEDLPAWLYVWHSNNGIVFGPDDKLYVPVGASTDHDAVTIEYEASILRMNPDGSELEVLATGFRNPYDLTFSPDGDLFAGDNGPDDGPDDLPDERRVEELNHIREGLFYGFPQTFGISDNPDITNPVTEFDPHVATSGLVYYADGGFPAQYHDGIFVAHWGGSQTPTGQQIVFVSLEEDGDTFIGEWEVFAEFSQLARPVDVTVGPDGALYVSEFERGILYRIEYVGDDE